MTCSNWLLLGWLLFWANPALSQAGRWEQALGSAGRAGGRSICLSPDGGLVLAGSRGGGRSTLLADSSRGTGDALVAKYSATGQLLWNHVLGGDRGDEGWRIRPTPEGGYLLCVASGSGRSFDHSQPERGGEDYWVLKLDAQGGKVWDRTLGTDSVDAVYDGWPTADGGYLVAGVSTAGPPQGDKSEPGRGGVDGWLVKLDAQGRQLWDHTYGGAGDDYLIAGVPTPDGGSLLLGYTNSAAGGDVSQAGQGGCDFWVLRLDAQGNRLWDRRYGGAQDDLGVTVVGTPDGGFLLGGGSYSGQEGDKSQPSRGDQDYWLVKISSQGARQWDVTLGTSEPDYLVQGLTVLANGNYVVLGFSRGGASGDRTQPGRGETDCWAVGLSPTGQVVWDAAYGGSDDDFAGGAVATADGGFAFVGHSYSPVSGERTAPPLGASDAWLVKATATGARQWDRALGSNADDLQQAILQQADGSYWLAGHTEGGPGLDNEETIGYVGQQHAWLLQRDSLGAPRQTASLNAQRRLLVRHLAVTASNQLLVAGTVQGGYVGTVPYRGQLLDADYCISLLSGSGAELGGPGDDWLGEARATPDQGVIVGGTSRSGVGRQKSEASRGGADFWLVKLTRTFAKTWDHRYGGSGLDSLVSVRRLADGSYLLAGSTTSPVGGDVTEPGRGGADFWLVNVSSTGALRWQHRYGGPGDDWLAAARPTPDGGCLLLGTTTSAVGGEMSEPPLGRRDLWAVKVDAAGAVQWQHRYGGSGNDYAATLEVDPDGGFIVGASTTSPADGQVSEASRGGTDYWLLRLSAQGTVLWDKRLGGSGEDLLTCLTSTKGYGYAVGGTSNSPASSGEHQQANRGGYDYWTLVLGARRVPAPVITSFTPGQGPPGSQVVLTGNNFTGTSSVRLNGVEVTDYVVSDGGTTITVTLPAGATTGPLAVTANGTGTSATDFVVPTTPLPVQLVAFAARATAAHTVHLHWQTASELHTDYFEVQRSLDGRAFAALGRQPAAGSSSTTRSYQALDPTPPTDCSTVYYRLKTVDADGSASYSPSRAVLLFLSTGTTLSPNPARQRTLLAGALPTKPVQVLDALGRVVFSTVTDAQGEAQLVLPAGLAPGLYLVRQMSNEQVWTGRLIIAP